MEKIAIKELAYFLCKNGDLTIDTFQNKDDLDGKKAHKYVQDQYGDNGISEVYIKREINIYGKDYLLHGFIDGVLKENNKIIIEEIKSLTEELDLINLDDHKEHLAQAKLYSYLFMLNNDLEEINVRLTYINLLDYSLKSFNQIYNLDELEEFTFKLLEEYINFLNLIEKNNSMRQKTIEEIKFPYEKERMGQRTLMGNVYHTLKDEKILYAIAPTGIGKTMATIFPALKTLNKNDKLFYTTAKGSGKNAPLEAMKLLEKKGLICKTINIVAKNKICNQKVAHCNPDECPFALGYYDRLKDGIKEIYENYNIFDSDVIEKITNKHKLCAFEFSLYLSYYADVIIADYNYVFDPHAHLIRYFDDDTYNPKVLVDEAHNLISRSKDMYSSLIKEEDIRHLRKITVGLEKSIRSDCNALIKKFDYYHEKLRENALYVDKELDLDVVRLVKNLISSIDNLIAYYKDIKKKIPNMDSILEIYFSLLSFDRISELFSDSHKFIARLDDDYVILEYMCLDASKFIYNTIESSIHGIVFFSATLYPIDYHKNLITGGIGDDILLKSPFDPSNFDIIINNKISTKYRNREESIDEILEIIEETIKYREGNYIVFFPSYKYLKMIEDNLELDIEIIVQNPNMTDIEKNEIINKFMTTTNPKLGLFVLGGSFSEGIDLIGDALNGVIIVGVGLPLLCDENNILKDYFEEKYQNGYDYAYTYPGFTKVIQAVGRVIRDINDRGIAILIDERFTYPTYKKLYPPHWKNIKIINNIYNLKKELDYFKRNK